ncbi:MAG: dockerin type I repeat-containing protein [Ruminococcus sp.]|uniref:dockerin type I repeat-containing protein n=1 Tax=Ruminococcus sp. TaxID=41978 RepID=UPI0028730C86|nr:dockerin type I repeat-containing protein [Ruminococcus sp.]MBQ3285922.1 dockerin type I repeat-containing protein [Ruminococcus sp.]
MKKLLCILLVVTLTASAFAAFTLNTSAAGGKLTVTSRGEVLGEVEVGNEFIYNVAFSSSGYSVMAGEGSLFYNSDYVELVEHGTVKSDGSINMTAYSFPPRLRNTNLITNYFGQDDEVLYNFSKISGVGAFTEEDHFFKVRFKAIKPGTVNISHTAKVLYSRVGSKSVNLIYHNTPNDQLDPVPYIVSTVEPSTGLVGDADGDYSLTVMDATFVQRLTAGVGSDYNAVSADVDKNGEVNLRDALNILRYKAGVATDTQIGEWVFESEAELS